MNLGVLPQPEDYTISFAPTLERLHVEVAGKRFTFTPEEIAALLKKANFDHYNKIGTDILPPREAPDNT